MKEDRDYLDENGNDTRYGEYLDGVWFPDPPAVVKSKKSGEWDRFSPIQRRWVMDSCVGSLDRDVLRRINENSVKIAKMVRGIK
ncbi:MAG: hypothetical protein LBR80_06980 [Deltaproteobacteria bacterium]|jgi:hypothetical protein|nr:hypothetical protein [Deltaproteobacteria bacterium]